MADPRARAEGGERASEICSDGTDTFLISVGPLPLPPPLSLVLVLVMLKRKEKRR